MLAFFFCLCFFFLVASFPPLFSPFHSNHFVFKVGENALAGRPRFSDEKCMLLLLLLPMRQTQTLTFTCGFYKERGSSHYVFVAVAAVASAAEFLVSFFCTPLLLIPLKLTQKTEHICIGFCFVHTASSSSSQSFFLLKKLYCTSCALPFESDQPFS